ncbi:MAG: CoA-binding protein [Candidatus Krumholzibacteriia bacterium]
MTSRAAIDEFLAQDTLALVGASRGGKAFGNAVLKALRKRGREVLPVHQEARIVNELPCFRAVADLPPRVGGLVLVVPPEQTEKLVVAAAAAGIRRIWMQRGAESPAALAFCAEHGLTAIHGECILMFAEPAGRIHRLHRGLRRLLGRMPQ